MNNPLKTYSIFTWKRSYRAEYPNISPDAVWQTWQDVNNWPLWHPHLESCKLEGPFETGSQFLLQAKGAPSSRQILTQVEKNHSFTDSIKFFGAIMYNVHTITPKDNGITITHTTVVKGILAPIWIHLIAKKIIAAAPQTTNTLIAYAQRTYQI